MKLAATKELGISAAAGWKRAVDFAGHSQLSIIHCQFSLGVQIF
jgi:hypothetical protein